MKDKPHLAEGTIVDHFSFEKVIGGGGFSVVYLGHNLKTDEKVIIKEYFPSKLSNRNPDGSVQAKDEKSEKLYNMGRKLFFQEAGILAALDHPNIVNVLALFHGNNTVYTAMEFRRGVSLQAYIRKRHGQLPEALLRNIFKPILEALKSMHEMDLLHLDIKPGNIFLCDDGTPILLDFGAVHKLLRTEEARQFPVVSHGFSPIEQSNRSAKLGPYTDIYAIGATMRACIQGNAPVPAKERRKTPLNPAVEAFKNLPYSPELLKLMDWAMALPPKHRPQTVDEYLLELEKLPPLDQPRPNVQSSV